MEIFIERPANKASLSQRKSILGIGINDSNYIIEQKNINGKNIICPFYSVWDSMIRRCYSLKLHERYPAYVGCTVCEEWLLFSVFKKWMEKQDWKQNQLDKDIKIVGNKIYGPDTCLFVSKKINTFMTHNKKIDRPLPTGVYLKTADNKFHAESRVDGKKKMIGVFDNVNEAACAYINFRRKIIIEVARLPENKNIKKYLLLHAEAL